MDEICNCKIISIKKDDMRICSARVIFATLEDEHGERYRVQWISGTTVKKTTGEWEYQEMTEFIEAWDKAEVGMKVNLCLVGGNRSYFLINDC